MLLLKGSWTFCLVTQQQNSEMTRIANCDCLVTIDLENH